MRIFYTARFLRSLKKLSPEIQEDAVEALRLFAKEPKSRRLHYHKLKGKFSGYHSLSANFRYRIIVSVEGGDAYCMDIGPHSIYERQ